MVYLESFGALIEGFCSGVSRPRRQDGKVNLELDPDLGLDLELELDHEIEEDASVELREDGFTKGGRDPNEAGEVAPSSSKTSSSFRSSNRKFSAVHSKIRFSKAGIP